MTNDSVDFFARIEELKYMYASNVNVSNFISVKLSGDRSYDIWKPQMLCLMESQKMVGIVDPNFESLAGATTEEIRKQYDSLLRGWILGSLSEDVLRKVIDLRSAKDVWGKLKSMFDPEIRPPLDYSSEPMITRTDLIVNMREMWLMTDGNKKLRKATVEGDWLKAAVILKKDKDAAKKAISNEGNTILHLAVGVGQNNFVKKWLNFIEDGRDTEIRNSDGHTALHIAAMVDNKYAAQLLVKKREELLDIPDNKSHVPLESALYSMQLNTFVYLLCVNKAKPLPQGLYVNPNVGVNLLINAIINKQYDLALTLARSIPRLAMENDQVLMAMARNFPSELDFKEKLICPSLNKVREKIIETSYSLLYSFEYLYICAKGILWALGRFNCSHYDRFPEVVTMLLAPVAVVYPFYQLICLLILVLHSPFIGLYVLLWKLLAAVAGPIKRIEKKKNDYKDAKLFLYDIIGKISCLSSAGNRHLLYSRFILEAASHGAYEVVDKILYRKPKAIDYKDRNGHDIIQLAIINRSEKIYNLIYHIAERKDFYRTVLDPSNNNILHLAARLAPPHILSRSTGAALQLQRELQWYEEVKKIVFPVYISKKNIFDETPQMVFTREHQNLVKEGEKWMKATAESCSITAALITTVVFAGAITVPGGSNQETGIPLFKGKTAFTVFAVADAISLFASATSLLVFLSILTARFSEQDFLVSLPKRLIIGLSTLFLSMTTMMIAFSATLYLVFVDHEAWMLAPIGVLACLPIAAFVTLQFPLVVDLFRSTYFPIFGKQSYIDRGMFNPNDIKSFFGNREIQSSLEVQAE